MADKQEIEEKQEEEKDEQEKLKERLRALGYID